MIMGAIYLLATLSFLVNPAMKQMDKPKQIGTTQARMEHKKGMKKTCPYCDP